jgi:cytochrome P450
MAWWMLAMVTYPDVQKRAQEELDSVVGRTRIPTFAELPHLPYIRAMVKEALRWRPVGPFGVLHLSTEDDWYNSMFIPKGSVMVASVWDPNRDTEIYGADAAHFNPARFLDTKGEVTSCAPETKEEVTSRTVSGGASVWGNTLQTTRFSSTLRWCYGPAELSLGGTIGEMSFRLTWTDV